MLEVTCEDISRLNAQQLTDLLRRLLHLEASKYGIPVSAAHVSLRINVGDGGEDGKISWDGGIDKTDFLPNRLVLFQCKAVQDFSAAQAARELIKDSDVKQRVDDVLGAGGAYVLFTTRPFNGQQIDERISKMREALRLAKVSYAEDATLEVYDANRIRDWANQYASAVIYVCASIGKPSVLGAKTWSEWASLPGMAAPEYVSNATLASNIDQIRAAVDSPKCVMRLTGLSTVGKTRLVFESFRPEEDIFDANEPAISLRVVYVDAEGATSLAQELSDLQRSQPYGVLVVDNCPLDLHKQLSREARREGSRLSLVTIDLNPAEAFDADPVLRMEPLESETIVAILKMDFSSIQDDELKRIAAFSQGFPEFAVRLAEAWRDKRPDVGLINDEEVVRRLLWGRGEPDKRAEHAVTALALFEQLGCDGAAETELEHVAQNVCGMHPDEFHQHIVRFQHLGIVERRGHFARVRMPPLAVELAAQWWRCTRATTAKRIIADLPDRLAEAMCERMTMLDFLQPAQDLVAELCGEQGSFGQAEVLNTERGSRLFRAFVEVNPEATSQTLVREFGNMSHAELREVSAGRRHLVWALEKLAFRHSTFQNAAQVLLRFSGAENEKWSNNATGVLLQLFHVHLSGTEVGPEDRLKVIDRALHSSVPQECEIGVEALKHALENSHFTRTCGAEQQGSGPSLRDWKPKYWSEIFSYWRECLDRLKVIMSGRPELASLARRALAEQVVGLLISDELIPDLEDAIRAAADSANGYWPEGYSSVSNAIRYRSPKLPEAARDALERWKRLLGPDNLDSAGRLRLVVSEPEWAHEEDESGKFVDISRIRAEDLANECAAESDHWLPLFKDLFSGEQRQGFAFGAQLGRVLDSPERLLELAVGELRAASRVAPNPAVLCGFLSTLYERYPSLVEETIDRFAQSPPLQEFLVALVRSVPITKRHLESVAELVGAGVIEPDHTRSLSYGKALDHLEPSVISEFALQIAGSAKGAARAALEILFMYTHGNAEHWNRIADDMRTLVTHPNLELTHTVGTSDWYHWQQVTAKLLTAGAEVEFASKVAQTIIHACAERSARYQVTEDVLTPLLERYFDAVWPQFGECLLERGSRGFWLSEILGVSANDKSKGSPLFRDDLRERLFKWVDETHGAPEVLARITPIYESGEESASWHAVARHLIDEHSQKEGVLSGILANLGSFGWTGSLVPHYEKQLRIFSELLDHDQLSVRAWATKYISWLKSQIDHEVRRDEDRQIGVYW